MKIGVKTTPRSAEMGVRNSSAGQDQRHIGHLLGDALRRFDAAVLVHMAHHVDLSLDLANLAARDQISAAHIHLTRHLPLEGARASHLALSAGMTKQSMSDILDQCEAWGLITRETDTRDKRAKWVRYTPRGEIWLQAFVDAVSKAEVQLRDEVGEEVATVIRLGLEAYSHGYS